MPKPPRNLNAPQTQSRPVATATSPSSSASSSPRAEHDTEQQAKPLTETDISRLKTDLLLSLHEEIKTTFKVELNAALEDNLSSIKSELLQFRTEFRADITAMKEDFTGLRGTVADMEQSLSGCTDDITSLRSQVENMAKEMVKLENKCEDLESRSRRNNIRILGVPENHIPSCDYVTNLLTEAFKMTTPPLVDRAHRSLAPKPGPGERPRAIVARLHYYSDCVSILRSAREQQRIAVRDMNISIFPDYTAKTARARAAFNDVRRQLRDIEGIRFGILHPGKLRITYRGVQRDFTSPGEAKAYISTITSSSAPK